MITTPDCFYCLSRGVRVYRHTGDVSTPHPFCAACFTFDPRAPHVNVIPHILDNTARTVLMAALTPDHIRAFLQLPEAKGARFTYSPNGEWSPTTPADCADPCAVFAVAEDGAFGMNNALPWPHVAQDMARFRALTWEGAVIAGPTTADALSDLPSRSIHELRSYHILEERLSLRAFADTPARRAVIGGATVLREAVNPCDVIKVAHITLIEGAFEATTRFDLGDFIAEGGWRLAASAPRLKCRFLRYER